MRMRKISLIFLGLIAGAGLTLLATQTHRVFVDSSANAAFSNAFRELDLFGEVFERVRALT
jgi:carboxyl-terminal processing protease